jgi:hypothetical protein
VALFQGRDRTGDNVDFVADGSAAAMAVGVAVLPKIPDVLGFEKRTVSNSSIAITASSVPAGSTHALATLEGGDCRFREDAGTATGTDGLLMLAGQAYEFTNLANLRFIRASYETADVTLQVSYRKYS